MGSGAEENVIDLIHLAEREDAWLIINEIHLMKASFFKQFCYHIHRIQKSKGLNIAFKVNTIFYIKMILYLLNETFRF